MKKTAFILVFCLLATVCLSACGQTGALLTTQTVSSDPSAVKTERDETPALVVTEEGERYLSGDVRNADGDEEGGDGPALDYGLIGYVYFGSYPQTIAEKDALKQMSQTTDETGYYVSAFDGAHYARIMTSDVYGEKYEFTNERKIERRTTYYFKVEPIKWRVYAQLSLTGDLRNIYLVSDVILDGMAYTNALDYEEAANMQYYLKNTEILANNWAYSAVRKWLNGTFLKQAFTAKEKEKLVDRPVSEVTSVFEENDATDKVYTLGLEQVDNLPEAYLLAQVTDYARCHGTFMSVYSAWYGNGRYWLSDAGSNSYSAAFVSDYKYVLLNSDDTDKTVSKTGESVGAEYMGVRPAITMTVDSMFEILTKEEEEE